MHVLITGGTGWIGSALAVRWAQHQTGSDHHLSVLTRNPSAAARTLSRHMGEVSLHCIRQFDELDGLPPVDHIINLAGEGIADKPWSERRKAELIASRVTLTEDLLTWVKRSRHQPRTLISGSAIGWYGNQEDRVVDETSAPHDEFVHRLCHDWEQPALAMAALGVRVCVIRTGVVIGPNGGFLKRLLPVFGLGLGGPLGAGTQYLSWVSLADVLDVIERLRDDTSYQGIYNLTAPRAVTNAEFTRTLASLLRRPAFFRVPAPVLRLALGEMSTLLLDGQRVVPSRLLQARYRFQHATLEEALRAALGRPTAP